LIICYNFLSEFIKGPNIKILGFGHVILSRIHWSMSSDVGIVNYTGDIHRGVWAGHRFDITTIGRHQEEMKGVEWEDVGEEISTELATIWAGK
jgi:hypothetical protein